MGVTWRDVGCEYQGAREAMSTSSVQQNGECIFVNEYYATVWLQSGSLRVILRDYFL